VVSGEYAVALTGKPGQHVIAEMVKIVATFTSAHGRPRAAYALTRRCTGWVPGCGHLVSPQES
jgi:hypothetical protein